MSNRLQLAISHLADVHNVNQPNFSNFPHVSLGDFDAMYAAVAPVLEDFPPQLHEQLYEIASAVIGCKNPSNSDSIYNIDGSGGLVGCGSEDIFKKLDQAASRDRFQREGTSRDGKGSLKERGPDLDYLNANRKLPSFESEKNSVYDQLPVSYAAQIARMDTSTYHSYEPFDEKMAGIEMDTLRVEPEMSMDPEKGASGEKGVTWGRFSPSTAEEAGINGQGVFLHAHSIGTTTTTDLGGQSPENDDFVENIELKADEESNALLRKTSSSGTKHGKESTYLPKKFKTSGTVTCGEQVFGEDYGIGMSFANLETKLHGRINPTPSANNDVAEKSTHPTSSFGTKLTIVDTNIVEDESARDIDWVAQLGEGIGYRRCEMNENIIALANTFTNGQRQFGSSYFAAPDGTNPEDNADTIALRALGVPSREKLVAAFGGRTTWTKRERVALRVAVTSHMGEDLELENERDVIEGWDKHVWKKVLMVGKSSKIQKRDEEDAMCVYLNSESRWVGGVKWREDECLRLEEGIKRCLKQADSGGWVNVAKTVGGRSSSECLRRWRTLEEERKRKRSKGWSKDDDRKLVEVTRKLGEGNWASIALMLGGKSGQQCLFRWRKVGAERKVGKWDKDELEKLRDAVQDVGMDWVAVSKRVGGRSDVQCREKWVNCERPEVAKGAWGNEEDKMLIEFVELLGVGRWSKIAKGIKGRTGAQCKKRWSRLNHKTWNKNEESGE